MRKSREETLETRKRIVSTAAAEIRKNGIVASGLNELMAAAGLTRGGFYKHFESKNQLVAEAFAEAMQTVIASLSESEGDGKMSAASKYLSVRHRDHPEAGCPLSAIGSELSRGDATTRRLAGEGFLQLVNLLAGQSGKTASAARNHAIVAVSTLVGAVTLSRVVNDPKLSLEILKEAEKSLSLQGKG